jgi:molybdopterin-guanine dinucleotide biosynthesis protein A
MVACVACPLLDAHMARTDRYALRGWMDKVGPRVVRLPDLELPNVNYREDLDRLNSRSPI